MNKNPFDYYLNPIDIYEHLPTLYRYTNECESVLECGVRGAVSSWAFVYGLLNNSSHNKKLILNDIQPCNIDTLLQKTKNINLDIEYKAGKGTTKTRVTGKEEALKQAKKLLLEIVEESFEDFFEYNFSEEVFTGSPALHPDYVPMDAP